jgi:hypothetical protein
VVAVVVAVTELKAPITQVVLAVVVKERHRVVQERQMAPLTQVVVVVVEQFHEVGLLAVQELLF